MSNQHNIIFAISETLVVCLRTTEERCFQEEEAREVYIMMLAAQDQTNIDVIRVYINVPLSIYTHSYHVHVLIIFII